MSEPQSALAREIKQTKPFGSVGEEAAIGLLRTANVIGRAFGGVVESAGITLQQYNVLRILRGAGKDGLPTLEIAERMVEQAPGITRMIDRLSAKGLVCRERCSEDRRVVYGCITAAGLRTLEVLDRPLEDAHRELLSTIREEDQRRLIELLDRIRAGVVAANTRPAN